MPPGRSRRRLQSASPKLNQPSRRSEKINSGQDNPGRVVERVSRTEYGAALGASVGSVNTTSIEYDDTYGYNFISRMTNSRPSGTLMTVRVPTTDDRYYLKVLLASPDRDKSGRREAAPTTRW